MDVYSSVYKLDDLQATVGKGQDFPTFLSVVDYVFEANNFGNALKIFDLTDVSDLAEAITDTTGHYSEDAAKELCLDRLDGHDIEDDDPEAEWGDEMYDRAAGKQVISMNDAQKWLDQIIEDIPFIEKGIYEDAKTLGTYGKAKKYVRSFKHDFGGDFSGTPEEQMYSAFNTMLEDVVSKLNQDSNNAEIQK